MNIHIGDADSSVAVSIAVINDFFTELKRIGKIPSSFDQTRDVGGTPFNITILVDTLTFEMAKPTGQQPYTRLLITGTLEGRPVGSPPDSPPVFQLPLDIKALLSIVLVADDDPEPDNRVPAVGLRYDGTDGTPAPPVTAADVDALFANPGIAGVINETKIPLAKTLVEGLNKTRFPIPANRPALSSWSVVLTLLSSEPDTVDAFAVSVGPQGTTAIPVITSSFMLPNTGLAVAYNRNFLDEMLFLGAAAKIGTVENEAKIEELTLKMSDTAIDVKGHFIRPFDTPIVDILPDIDIRINGPMVPSLVRGTTGMAFDLSGVNIDIDDSDEIFVKVLKWFLTIGSSLLLFTGLGSLTGIGILLWLTLVQKAWNGDAKLDNAPNVIRDSLATAMGAQLGKLSETLDDDTDAGQLRIDATPDSLLVVSGNMVFYAQILVVAITARMRSAEYSKKLKRFVIFELDNGRRFRAQELARLMKIGKITIPGFHEVGNNYIRANHDDAEANNLLQQFQTNLTKETVVRNKKR
jgi:hypothetical protein